MISSENPFSRIMALVLLAIFLAVSVMLGIAPAIKSRILKAELMSARESLAAFNASMIESQQQGSEPGPRLPQFDPAKIYLPGRTAGIAGASLQARLIKLFDHYGASSKSVQVLRSVTNNKSDMVSVSMNATMGMKALRGILYDIETSTPLLFIDAVTIQKNRNTQRRHSKAGPIILDVSIKISGYKLTRPAT